MKYVKSKNIIRPYQLNQLNLEGALQTLETLNKLLYEMKKSADYIENLSQPIRIQPMRPIRVQSSQVQGYSEIIAVSPNWGKIGLILILAGIFLMILHYTQ